MARNIARVLRRLGACSAAIRQYGKFGDDFEAAMRAASINDIYWVLSRVHVPPDLLAFRPKSCIDNRCLDTEPLHLLQLYSSRRKRSILRAVWSGSRLKKR